MRRVSEAAGPEVVARIQKTISRYGGKSYIVGGAVRDELIPGSPASKDVDFMVTGLPLEKLARILSSLGKVSEVGKDFGIIKALIDGEDFDFALPRTAETKTGERHTDFSVTTDHKASPEDDLARRDFTINALAKDEQGNLLDLFGGAEDIKNKLIRAVGDARERFSEDPLRILRAIQFASRFGFEIEKETANAAKSLKNKLKSVAGERVLEEFIKAWTKGNADTDVLVKLLDELGVGNFLFGPDFKPIAIDFNKPGDKAVANFVAFFLLGGKFDALKPTNDMEKALGHAQSLLAGKDFWEFLGDDVSTVPFLKDVFEEISKSTNEKVFKDIFDRISFVVDNKLPLSAKQLPVGGGEIASLGFKGKEIGDKQRELLAAVYSGQVKNDKKEMLGLLGMTQEGKLPTLKNIFEDVSKPPQIYCDMDGVLVDFEKGLPEFVNRKTRSIYENLEFYAQNDKKILKFAIKAVKELGGDLLEGSIPEMTFQDFDKAAGKKKVRNYSYALISYHDKEFWEGLEWLPDGKQLWTYINKHKPTILSSPVGKARGKIDWCRKNLGISEDRIILTHEKYEYAENGLLIDDTEKKVVPFEEHGGTAILHTSASDTIRKLKEVGL